MDFAYYKNKITIDKEYNENWFVLGIDLGTTNTVVSYWNVKEQKPITIDMSDGFGKIPMPSVVQYRNDSGEEWVVGEEAYNSMKIYEETTIRSIKRKMGTNEKITLGDKNYLPEEITAKILGKIIDACYKINPNAEIAGIVITVPYAFDDSAKRATLKACEIIGVKNKVLALVEEPKAATYGYLLRNNLVKKEKVLVFDFGGGTLDLTLFSVEESDNENIKLKVISEGGKTYHGGDNIDEILLDQSFKLIKEKTGLSKTEINLQHKVDLFFKIVEAKERLSKAQKTKIPFTFCVPPFIQTLTKEEYEELISDFIFETRKIILQCLKDTYEGAVMPNEINKIILLGGSSKNSWVKDLLIDIFQDEEKIYVSDKPALDISIGATYFSAMKMGIIEEKNINSTRLEIEFETVVPHDIGLIINKGGRKIFYPLILRGTPYKLAKKSKSFTLENRENETSTSFQIEIFERINASDEIEDCKLVGEVLFKNVPVSEEKNNKTKLKVTLAVLEKNGLVRGVVETTNYKKVFEPNRFDVTIVEG